MRLTDFVRLSEETKKSTVLHQGMLVGKRKSPKRIIFLFQVDAFYVEMFCNLETKAVESYRVFENTDLLEPYLAEIPLEGLLN